MAELLDNQRANAVFDIFEHTAFRLETRDVYVVDREQERFRRFLAGERENDRHPTRSSEWWTRIRRLTGDGKRVERVRVVTEPLTDYSRWLLHVGQHGTAAGEDIRYLPRSSVGELGIPYVDDYWLFDSRMAHLFHFEEDGRVKGRELIEDPATIVRLNYVRDAAWHYAIRWEVFADKHGLR